VRLALLPLLLALLASPARGDVIAAGAGTDLGATTEDSPRLPPTRLALDAAVADARESSEPADDPPSSPPPERSGSLLATGLAIFPGILVPGLGQLALGERDAALRFLAADVAALSMLFAGLATQSASGGSGELAPSFLLQVNAGISLLSTLWLADVLGSARGTAGWPEPSRRGDSLALAVGYTGLFGSPLAVGHGAHAELDLRVGRLTFEPSFAALSGGHLDARARATLALWRRSGSANRFGLAAGAGWRRFADDGFSVAGAELLADLAVDLGLLSRTLRHAALVGRLGAGVDAFDWDGQSFADGDALPRLVLEVGLEVPVTRRFDVELFYRLRKDELPGGVIVPGLFDSFLGFVEAQGRCRVSERWAIVGGARIGNGVMPWLAVESQLY